MRTRQQFPDTDPFDRAAPPTSSQCETTVDDRARARIKAGSDALDAADLRSPLQHLGLDDPAEITAQLAHRHQQGAKS